MNIELIRSETPLTKTTAYFNTAAASPPPTAVLEEVQSYLLDTSRIGTYEPDFRRETYSRVDAARLSLALFIGSAPDEIAFTKNTTESISLVAQGIDWSAGDEVLIADTENLSNLLPWRSLAARRGIVVKMVETGTDGLVSAAAFASGITSRTRLITFSHVSSSTGAVQEAHEICALARRHDALSLINGAQSVGMVETDVAGLGCDFLAGCGRKALRATEGTGFLYVRRALIERLEPVLLGWWNGNYNEATGQISFVPGARRLEAGCPSVPAILGLGAATRYAQNIGIGAIETRVRQLTTYAVQRLSKLPHFEYYGPKEVGDRIGIVPFNVRGVEPTDLVAYLQGEHCVIEAGTFMATALLARNGISKMARISMHYFNTEEEINLVADLIGDMNL
jgi:cysteine desulfurase/selenocysteine lyase